MLMAAVSAANRAAAKPALRHVFLQGSRANSPTLHLFQSLRGPSTCRPGAGHAFRDLSSRGARSKGQGSYSGRNQQKGRGRPRTGQEVAAVGLMAVVGGVMMWQGCQDAAPYTGRKRFMVIKRDGDLIKRVTASTWSSVKLQYGSQILPKTHQASQTVERIGARIAEASGLEGCKWEFIVVKDDTMNAFALPGGKVVVFTGLFDATPNSDALASVMGHEVGHVVANHGGEKISKSLLTQGFLLLLVSVMGFDYFDAARFVGNLFFDLPNSREMEREADYIGMQLMAKACFDPHEMPKTFARMKMVAKKKGVEKGPAYLSTHPADDERIAKQNEWMDSAMQTHERSGCSDLRNFGGVPGKHTRRL